MGQSIGELFVKLGFDVDDSKLKSFNNSVNDTFQGLLKFAGITATAAGMYEIAKGANETAVSMRQLNDQFRLSYDLQQRFAAGWAAINPGGSAADGLKVIGNIAKYSAGMPYGLTGTEYLRFGGMPTDSPEQMLQTMRRAMPEMLARYGAGQVTNMVSAITGDPRMMSYLQAKQDELDIAEKKRNLSDEERKNIDEEAKAVSGLKTAWDNFFDHIVAKIAPFVTPILEDLSSGSWIDRENERGRVRHIIGWNASVEEVDAYIAAHKGGSGASSSGFWQGQGYSNAGAAAWQAQMMAESGGNAGARNGNHVGLFQWDPGRRAKILAATGIDVANASAEDQMRAAAWEAQSMGIPSALKGRGAYDASLYLSSNFEKHEAFTASHGDEAAYRARMAEKLEVNNHVTIHMQTTADPKEAAEAVHQKFLDVTYPTINQGGF